MNGTRSRTTATTGTGVTYQEQAYNVVKAQIMNLELKPGEYVTDSQVADDLGISRTPVREALRRLEQEGLLINQARRGWKVYTLSLQDIHEIFDIKEALEGMIARRAAECQDEALRNTLRETLERIRRATEAGDGGTWQEIDIELHEVIFQMGANERAADNVRSLNDQWHRLRGGFLALQGRIQRSYDEHEAVVVQILAGDGESAEREMRIHIRNVCQELVRLLVNLVLPFVEEGV